MPTRLVSGLLRRLFGQPLPPDYDLSPVEAEFDPAFYRAQLATGTHIDDPFDHYLTDGWRQGHDPSAGFSTTDYLALNPDVEKAGLNPLIHYVAFGRRERRATMPSRLKNLQVALSDTHAENAEARLASDAAEIAPSMDLRFYEAVSGLSFPDAPSAARHYLSSGWQKMLDPNPHFSTSAYLHHYPDIAQAGIAPFLHFLRAGRAEGRIAQDHVAEIAHALADIPDLATLEGTWMHGRNPVPLLDKEKAWSQILDALGGRSSPLILAFTHDDYRANRGGVQLCVGMEAKMAEARGMDYLAIFPTQPRPRLAPEGSATPLYVALGTARIGPVAPETLADILEHLRVHRPMEVVIHALLGHAPEDISRLARAAGATRQVAWFHDSSFLCPSFALQRNLVRFCGAPDPGSTACRMCLFGAERQSHLPRLARLVGDRPTHAIAPSASAAAMIGNRSDLPFADITVLPHAVLHPDAPVPADPAPDGPTRVAFVGSAVPYKGYPVFRRLVRHMLSREDIEFHYFGAASHREPGVETTGVDVTPADPDAMVTALAEARIDFVLHWADVAETFSFSTYEAIRAGADVLTHLGTGNVAALVEDTGRGHVLTDEAALWAFFAEPSLARATRARRAARPGFTARPSALSFAVLDGPAAPATARQDLPETVEHSA